MNIKDGTLQTKSLRIEVTNQHIYYPDMWVMHCRELGISCKQLTTPHADSEQAAMIEATMIVEKQLANMLNELRNEMA
jgi:hypothetical protein